MRLAECSLPFEDLEAIARAEARRSPGLAPNGGWRWTSEDFAFAVSVLILEMEANGFRRARAKGMTRAQAWGYLLKALRNRLLDHAKESRRLELLDDLALDALPSPDGQRVGLDDGDAATLAAKLRKCLSEVDAWEVARRCADDGIGSSAVSHARTGPSRATRARRWKRACAALVRLAWEERLNRKEAGLVMFTLAARLTGGGQPE